MVVKRKKKVNVYVYALGLWVNHGIQVAKFRLFSIARSAGNVKGKRRLWQLQNLLHHEALLHALSPYKW